MTTNYSVANSNIAPVPEAFISVGKNRQKIYGLKTDSYSKEQQGIIYLPSQVEFEIELFNPTNDRYLAIISLNEKRNNRGIILNPGQRCFLDRYLDEAKKFLFEVYEVSTNDKRVEEAIKNNGSVKIEFFKEMVEPKISYYQYEIDEENYRRSISVGVIGNKWVKNDIANKKTIPYWSDFYYNNFNSVNNTNFTSEPTLDNFNYSNRRFSKPLKKETGIISKGTNSNQKLKESDFKAFYSPSKIVEYKLLPVSEKPLTTKEINEFKRYCSNCGYKVSKGMNYCPKCGHKL